MGGGSHLDRAEQHQAALAAAGARRVRGAYYTPPEVVAHLLDLALDPVLARRSAVGPDAVAAVRVLDPTCGTGNVLVAAAHRIAAVLEGLGVAPTAAAAAGAGAVRGVDTDADAVALCRRSLVDAGAAPAAAEAAIVVGDPLREDLPWGAVDVVVGNPPFLGQLQRETAADAGARRAWRSRFGAAASAYTDPGWLFLLAGARALAPGGSLALVQPLSLVSARDAAGVRSSVAEVAALRGVWLPGARRFDAAVEVVVPILDRPVGPTIPGTCTVWQGMAREAVAEVPAPTGRSWAPLLAAADAVPEVSPTVGGRLGDVARAAADFRDQYYGLVPHVVDRADGDDGLGPPLVTVGLIDPAVLWWGTRPCRFAKQVMGHPRVVLADLPPTLRAWAEGRLVPKVLVATQTRVPEVVVDSTGRLLPSVPTISVTPSVAADDPAAAEVLWRVAAVLSSPVVAALVARRHAGSGRSASAIRLRAADLADLPLPAGADDWAAAAARVRAAHDSADPEARRAHLHRAAVAMQAAYGLAQDHPVVAWWWARLPNR